jgi:hypothetical protein
LTDKLRLRLATLVAPLAVPLLILIFVVPFTGESERGLTEAVIVWATITSYLGCLVLGLPIVHLLLRLDRLTVANLSLAGFCAGAVVTFFVARVFVGVSGPGNLGAKGVVLFAVIGAIVGATFGVVARARAY